MGQNSSSRDVARQQKHARSFAYKPMTLESALAEPICQTTGVLVNANGISKLSLTQHVEYDDSLENHADHQLAQNSVDKPDLQEAKKLAELPAPQRPSLHHRSSDFLELQEDNPSGDEEDEDESPADSADPFDIVAVDLHWNLPAKKVYVTGTFLGWTGMVPMTFQDGMFFVQLDLTPGTHRLLFVVDGEMRCADHLPTATDASGNLVNYIDVERESAISMASVEDGNLATKMSNESSSSFSNTIPLLFRGTDLDSVGTPAEIPKPPQLPPQLSSSALNAVDSESADGWSLPVVNHAVINHVATSAVKNGILALSCTARYQSKLVTQVYYTPLQL